MPAKIPERIVWAVDTLDVRPDEKLLEIGCGLGWAVELVCEKLTTGKITAIDRSLTMASAAREKNREFIASGKANVKFADLIEAKLPERSFDKIFAFNVNVFWIDPTRELAEIKRVLACDGKLYIFHQPPPGNDPKEFAGVFQNNLKTNGFQVLDVLYKTLEPVSATCVVSKLLLPVYRGRHIS